MSQWSEADRWSEADSTTLFKFINKLVHQQGMTWQEKRNMLLDHSNKEDEGNLEEFAAWFDGEAK